MSAHTVLFVDDEPAILSALRRTLRNESYRILTTSSPKDVLGIIEKERVDLLVSDIDMPDLRGTELVAQVRRQFPEVVRILLTGRGTLETALQAINDGEVYRYLTKPWEEAVLRETLAQALQRLEELRRAAAAERAVQRRGAILAELEHEHPGISHVERGRDGYVLGAERLAELAERAHDLGLADAARLIKGA